MSVEILVLDRLKGEFQFFKHQFSEALATEGFIARKKTVSVSKVDKVKRFLRVKLFCRRLHKRKDYLIVPASGETLMFDVYPYFNMNIIPMVWDVWPDTWPELYSSLKKLRPELVFVTVREMADKISRDLGIPAYWIPEGIDASLYIKGVDLKNRPIDVYELGRIHLGYHKIVQRAIAKGIVKEYRGQEIDEYGNRIKLAYPTADSLIKALPEMKVIINFPQCDTNLERSGGLETLTQRYWEAMLSGAVMVGRSPQELLDLIGYDPVINVEWNRAEEQLSDILSNIEAYQALVNRNYETALKMSPWSARVPIIRRILKERGIL